MYRWIRDLHLYAGLFLGPFILLFAVSTVMFNHTWKPGGEAEATVRTETIVAPQGLDGVERARAILDQVGVTGEISHVRGRGERFSIPVDGPGWRTLVRVDLVEGTAQVEERRTGFWDAILYLHKSPGPHNATIRGNWAFTVAWRGVVDAVVGLLMFASISGIYLWWALRPERRLGYVVAAAGGLSFVLLVVLVI